MSTYSRSLLLILTLGLMVGCNPVSKHSGGRYQYVPTPCDVSSMLLLFSSMIFARPKSEIFISPLWNRMFCGFRSYADFALGTCT